MMQNWLAVLLGGAAGAACRYAVALAALRWVPASFPLGTFVVNLAGSFLIGLLLPLAVYLRWTEPVRLLLVTGFLGAFTTFSTFSYETLLLWQEDRIGLALLNAVGSVVLGLLCVGAGYWLSQRVLSGTWP